ncbi:B3 domain-containing protein [Hordeum vulgare]|nr:B3 domain-containing protein [Hordeum vulgare]
MASSRSDSDQSRSIDWGVIPFGVEEAMAVQIALRRFREDSSTPTAGSVRRDSIASAQRALCFYGAGSHRERPKAYLAEVMVETEAADAAERVAAEEEAIRARILKRRRLQNTRALARERNRAVCEIAGVP